jgi:F-type H+-transporting ATPase subunit epsilon
MRLRVATPAAVVVDAEDVHSLRAEDATGHFGILPGHADFLTVLDTSVITWRDPSGGEHFVAVRGGILTVQGGRSVEVVSRAAVAHDDLRVLRETVLTRLQEAAREEAEERVRAAKLHLALVRQLTKYLRAGTAAQTSGQHPEARRRILDLRRRMR